MTMSPTDRSSTAATLPPPSTPRMRLGAHVSGGGLKGIPGKAVTIGCEGIQIFASSPQMWRPPNCKPDEAAAFRAACAEAGLGPVAVHAIYLVNPASEGDEHRAKTIVSLVKTLEAAEMLGASCVVTHLGSSKGSTKAEALDRSCRTFAEILEQYTGPVRLLFETSAGAGDTMGGAFEVIATGVPPGLGSYVQWDRKLDGRLGQALLCIHAIKAVGIGIGPEVALRPGSRVHDEILPPAVSRDAPVRPTNNAGGLEGGVTNGQDLRVTGFMKPIATLMNPLRSVDLTTMQNAPAAIERSDVCAVPAAAVVGEAMVSFVLADAFLEKFGGDSVDEIARHYAASADQIAARFAVGGGRA